MFGVLDTEKACIYGEDMLLARKSSKGGRGHLKHLPNMSHECSILFKSRWPFHTRQVFRFMFWLAIRALRILVLSSINTQWEFNVYKKWMNILCNDAISIAHCSHSTTRMEDVEISAAADGNPQPNNKKHCFCMCAIWMLLVSDTEFQGSSRLLIVGNLFVGWICLIGKGHSNLELVVFVCSWGDLEPNLSDFSCAKPSMERNSHIILHRTDLNVVVCVQIAMIQLFLLTLQCREQLMCSHWSMLSYLQTQKTTSYGMIIRF